MEKEMILEKYQAFYTFLESVDLTELRMNYTRADLTAFQKELEQVRLRSLPYEIGQLTEEMKKETYPELVGVHHYPEIKEIDFLSEQDKLALDAFLTKFTPHQSIVHSLWRVIKHPEKEMQTKAFLLQKGILETVYSVFCPHGCGHRISTLLNEAQFNELQTLIESHGDMETIEKLVSLSCDECAENIEIDQLKTLRVRENTKLVKERDKTYDNL